MSLSWQDIESRKRTINDFRRDLSLDRENHDGIVDAILALPSDPCPHRDLIRACQRVQYTRNRAVEWILEQMMIGAEDREKGLLLAEGQDADLTLTAKKGLLGVALDWIKLAGAAFIGALTAYLLGKDG